MTLIPRGESYARHGHERYVARAATLGDGRAVAPFAQFAETPGAHGDLSMLSHDREARADLGAEIERRFAEIAPSGQRVFVWSASGTARAMTSYLMQSECIVSAGLRRARQRS